MVEALTLLWNWRIAGHAVAVHILGCPQCLIADRKEAQHLPADYCSTGDALWAEEMKMEAQVIAILPDLPAEVRDEVPANFKFMTGHE
jgi:hypothetical protein